MTVGYRACGMVYAICTALVARPGCVAAPAASNSWRLDRNALPASDAQL